MSLSVQQKLDIVREYGKNENDTGAEEVQVALKTALINQLRSHFDAHKKDNHSRRGMKKMVTTRRRLLDYLMKRDLNRYRALIKKLGLRR